MDIRRLEGARVNKYGRQLPRVTLLGQGATRHAFHAGAAGRKKRVPPAASSQRQICLARLGKSWAFFRLRLRPQHSDVKPYK